jgi:SOS response regulatory protein OraA/RecX
LAGSSAASQAINYLMTELWDKGFSQSEIREAFNAAVADMPRYAAGEERRS